MTPEEIKQVVSQMQQASSDSEAERARWLLEAELLPNQVIMPGCALAVAYAFAGLPRSSRRGELESWEFLSQAAAGASGQTAASASEVEGVRVEVLRNLRVAVDRVSSSGSTVSDFLAVDLLDAVLTFADPELRHEMLLGLEAFSRRGPREAARVDAVVGDH